MLRKLDDEINASFSIDLNSIKNKETIKGDKICKQFGVRSFRVSLSSRIYNSIYY